MLNNKIKKKIYINFCRTTFDDQKFCQIKQNNLTTSTYMDLTSSNVMKFSTVSTVSETSRRQDIFVAGQETEER